MSTTALLDEMVEMLEGARGDATKWDAKEVDAAGMRMRKVFLNLTKKAKEGREAIQEIRNAAAAAKGKS
jgi:hypothetical protein